jgi:O-antigen/teichoic acid export membrane protein
MLINNNNMESNISTESIRSIAKHSAIYSVADLLKKGVGFFMIPLYTHYLSPADYGLLEILTLILEIIAIIIGARLLSAKTRFYHFYKSQSDKRELYSTALLFVIAINIIVVAALSTSASKLSKLLLGGESYAPHLLIIIMCFGIQSIYLVGENDLIIRKKSFFYSILSLGLMILGLSLNILFLSKYHMGVWAILWSMLIVKCINLFAVIPYTLRGSNLCFSIEKLKRMLRYGLPLVPASLAMFAIHFGDRFILQKYCSLSDVGIYSLGYKFGMIISLLIADPFQRSWSTHSFEIAEHPDAKATYARIFTYYSFLLILTALAIVIFINDLIGVVVPDTYANAAQLVPIIILAYVFMALANFVMLGLMITFKTQRVAYFQIPLAVLNIGLNIVLIKPLGSLGAALATAITFGLMLIISFWMSQRAYPISYEYTRLAFLAGTAIALYSISKLFSGSWLFQLGLHCTIVAAFPISLYALKFFNRDEIRFARSLFRHYVPWIPKSSS